MSFGHEKLARLLSQVDLAYDDSLSVCKALADISSNQGNALRIAASPELTKSMSNVLNSSRNTDVDARHQVQVCLAITRCVVAGGDAVSLAFSKSPGLVEGLCRLKRDPEPFVRVAAIAALRLLVQCDEACGMNKCLLRAKWTNVVDADQKSAASHQAGTQPSSKVANTALEQQGSISDKIDHAKLRLTLYSVKFS